MHLSFFCFKLKKSFLCENLRYNLMNIKMKRGIFMKNNIVKTLSKKEFATLEIQKMIF